MISKETIQKIFERWYDNWNENKDEFISVEDSTKEEYVEDCAEYFLELHDEVIHEGSSS